jgi:hypothetical protein
MDGWIDTQTQRHLHAAGLFLPHKKRWSPLDVFASLLLAAGADISFIHEENHTYTHIHTEAQHILHCASVYLWW